MMPHYSISTAGFATAPQRVISSGTTRHALFHGTRPPAPKWHMPATCPNGVCDAIFQRATKRMLQRHAAGRRAPGAMLPAAGCHHAPAPCAMPRSHILVPNQHSCPTACLIEEETRRARSHPCHARRIGRVWQWHVCRARRRVRCRRPSARPRKRRSAA